MHNGIKIESVLLPAEKTYTPEKGNLPVCPCETCGQITPEKFRTCQQSQYTVCDAYVDYEHMNAAYKRAVFD